MFTLSTHYDAGTFILVVTLVWQNPETVCGMAIFAVTPPSLDKFSPMGEVIPPFWSRPTRAGLKVFRHRCHSAFLDMAYITA